MRPLRCPLPRGLYELCTRVTGNALLARPSEEVNDVILGVIGRAQELHGEGVELHAFVFASSHYHMLVSVEHGQQLSDFLQFVNGNIARKLNIINDRDGTMWQRRFRSIPVAADEATQTWRLRYLLAHGTKEALVGRVEDWPGASSLPWLRDGLTIRGKWQDRTALYYAKRRKGYVEKPGDFTRTIALKLTVLPCWRHLRASSWRRLVRSMIAELNEEANARVAAGGRAPMGAAKVLATDPFTRVRSKGGRAPSVLAPDKATRKAMMELLRERASSWREAAALAMAVMTGQPGISVPLPAMYWWALGMRV